MRTSRGAAHGRLRPARARARHERGAIMMFVLLATLLIATITVGVMNLIAADQAAGVREMQAVQVFNVAEAGVQYAIGRLQTSGASTYGNPQQTLTVTNGATTLGTATIRVNCLTDTSCPPATWPCTGAYGAYRRIISTGSLAVGGPSRTVVAVVQGYGLAGSSYALCAYSALSANTGATIFGDVGSNGSITLQGGATVNGGVGPPAYTGLARANGTITCTPSCGAQVAGGATPNATGWVCPTTLPTGPFAPGASDWSIGSRTTVTMNGATGFNWHNITLAAGQATCNAANPYTTLQIQSGAAGTTTVVQVNQLTMGNCTRLMVLGSGNVDLRIGAASGTGLSVGTRSHFGVLSTDTRATPAPVPASQMLVEVTSSGTCATSCAANIQSVDTRGVASGVFLVPNGEIQFGTSEQVTGAILASSVTLGQTATYTYDTSAGGAAPLFNFYSNLRSWKDQ